MKGKVVCVTGASRGIGAAIARRMLAADVSKLILVARKSEDFDNVMAELEDKKTPNQQVIQLVADLSQTDETYRIVNRLLKNSPNIDILINNAGYTAPNSIFEATFSEFVETVNVNVYAPFILIQELLHRGNKFTHVLNVASTAGLKGRAGWSTYSASKAALIAMTESLREELAPLGVRVICVSPGSCRHIALSPFRARTICRCREHRDPKIAYVEIDQAQLETDQFSSESLRAVAIDRACLRFNSSYLDRDCCIGGLGWHADQAPASQ
jgi:3-oxoacyl-[acyl-carrier protein] reductase